MIDTTEASPLATSEQGDQRSAPSNGAGGPPPPVDRPARPVGGAVPANLPRIVRPQGLPHAGRPVDPPVPEHHHLPGWVRRVHGQARPILADLLGGLTGETLDTYQAQVDALIAGMSAGRFSLAWQYPKLIADGMTLFEAHRRDNAVAFAAARELDARRKKGSDALREAGGRLAPDAIARLNRALRGATSAGEIDAVSAEIEQTVVAARSNEERRRDREIDRTRSRIRKTLPRATVAEPSETWQDVLRRYAETQAAP